MNNDNLAFIKSIILLTVGASTDLITTLNEWNVVLEFVLKLTSFVSFFVFILINWSKIIKVFKK